jgi:hypothetical protein
MNTEDERKTAAERVDLYRVRFSQFGEDFFPLQIALRWRRAVQEDPIDLRELKEIFDTAVPRKSEFDVAFFTFCNHMEAVVCSRLTRSD